METIDEVITATDDDFLFQEDGRRENFPVQLNFRTGDSRADVDHSQ